MPRHLLLPQSGLLMVSTDVHGNLRDFEQLCEHFRSLPRPAHWVILGDIVHGPDEHGRARSPKFYDYVDESLEIVRRVMKLCTADNVHCVMGNHEWAHVGGPRTRKFHVDEADYLEQQMSLSEIRQFHQFLYDALLAVSTPCGALLTHGAPRSITSLDALDALDLAFLKPESEGYALVSDILTSYGQIAEDVDEMLKRVSTEEYESKSVIHGHDRDEHGYFIEGDNQFCPVIFGAPDANKRFLVMDLSQRYDALTLAESGALRHLY